jgi:hypothetical protein
MITLLNQKYIQFNHVLISEYKSRKYFNYVKKLFPKMDIHHLLLRKCDYLLWGFKHSFHIQTVHKHKPAYFEKYLEQSLTIFINYCLNELHILQQDLESYLINTEPETIKQLFDFVYSIENKKERAA